MNTQPAAPPPPAMLRSLPGSPPWQNLHHMTATAAGIVSAAEQFLPPVDFLEFLDRLAVVIRDRSAAAYAAAAPVTLEEFRSGLAAAMRRYSDAPAVPSPVAA